MRRFVALIAPVLVAGFAATPPAWAGTYDVSACDAAPEFANNSWKLEVTSPTMHAFSACPSGDNPRYGLGARHRFQRAARAAQAGAATRWRFQAPPDASIVGVRANALFEQLDSRWRVGLFTRSDLVSGCLASRRASGSTCVGAMSAGDYVPLAPTDLLYSEVSCPFGGCPLPRSGRPAANGSITFARVTIADGTSPSVAGIGGDLWQDEWINGTRQVTFDATDNTGIKAVRVSVDGGVKSSAGRDCDPTQITCPGWPGVSQAVATTDLADGKHTLSVEAIDRADNTGGPTRQLLVDNTPPASPRDVAVGDGEGWRSKSTFVVTWKNPPQEFAPIAGAEYTLCPTAPSEGDCVRGTKDGRDVDALDELEVSKPGDWQLTTWLRDEAGNQRADTAAEPVHLRFDPNPPQVAIHPSDPEQPSRVLIDTADDLSGVVRGEIEMRRQGTDTWRQLEAAPEGSGFAANLHDERLADGVYELRARAWDAAGNERSSEQLTTGEPARLTLPLRIKTQLRVGKTIRTRATGARHHRRPARTRYVTRPLIAHGAGLRLHGRLVAPGDNPLQGVPVEVTARADLPGATFAPVATLTTSRTGRFNYLVPPGESRVLQFSYAGAPKIRPQTQEVQVRVRAASSIRPSRSHVVNGETVLFVGRLKGGALPADGKLVELQYFDRGKWRTFRTARADAADGRWRVAYRFDGTRGVRSYRFRLRIPREAGYPFSTGSSRSTRVTVRGL